MDEGLLGDPDGHVICGTRSNLFWVFQGRLFTPALDNCGVAGVMRSKIFEAAASIKIPVSIGKSDWNVLLSSDEAFICNSLIGIWPLRSLATRQWRGCGPITAALQRALAHPRIG
jgi:4-amino-4-deoxychorismate lyase